MEEDLVGNTRLTVREFNQIIKEKQTAQLQNKIKLGAQLIQNFERELETNPKAPDTITSLQQQIQMLKRELKRREQQATIEARQRGLPSEQIIPAEQKSPTSAPADQVVGVSTLKLKGKTGMG